MKVKSFNEGILLALALKVDFVSFWRLSLVAYITLSALFVPSISESGMFNWVSMKLMHSDYFFLDSSLSNASSSATGIKSNFSKLVF